MSIIDTNDSIEAAPTHTSPRIAEGVRSYERGKGRKATESGLQPAAGYRASAGWSTGLLREQRDMNVFTVMMIGNFRSPNLEH